MRLGSFRLNMVLTAVLLVALVGLVVKPWTGAQAQGGEWQTIAQQRGLTEADLRAAVMTYTPSGKMDDYLMFASGGQSGQMLVIGMPSMRLLRSIAVFTPEPWQGWGYPAGNKVLDEGNIDGQVIRWGDTHHPALSETGGDYDGSFVFIGDKANGRVAVVDLRDFETKQIVHNPAFLNDHGGTFVTPNTEYIIEGGQYGLPLGGDYAPLSDYQKTYRGMVTFWKFDREKGRIDVANSFAMELPPYWQDLCDAGKLASDGLIFCNSFNAEMATGGIESGNPPFEAGVSKGAVDYLHIIDWRGAEAAFQAGDVIDVKGFKIIPLEKSLARNLLYFSPEPRSPHGADVTPKGDFVVIGGKLDPNVTGCTALPRSRQPWRLEWRKKTRLAFQSSRWKPRWKRKSKLD